MKNIIKSVIILISLGVGGCMVGPDYERPETLAQRADGFVYGGLHAEPNAAADVPWWRTFGDPVTEELVEIALMNNYDIEAAAARVLQAQALLSEARGALLPQVDYEFSALRSKSSFAFGEERFSSLFTTIEHQFRVSYVVDIFGRLRRAQRSTWAQLLASEASRQAVENTIIASVVRTRAQIATSKRSLAIARENAENWSRNLSIIERRYRSGLVGPLDVRLARENLAATQANEMFFERSVILAQNALSVLLARQPGTIDLPETLDDLPELADVPVSVPAALLERRPDVLAAEMQLRSANEQIGVSIAQMLPSFNIGAGWGSSSDRLGDSFSPGTEIYSALISVVQPIFRGGQLRARVKFSEAQYQELAAQYAGTVVTAMREVEDALASDIKLRQRMGYLIERFEQARAAEDLAEQRYLRGVEQLVTVLEAERRRRIAEQELNEVKGNIWENRVDLYLALGGDWTFLSDKLKVKSEK